MSNEDKIDEIIGELEGVVLFNKFDSNYSNKLKRQISELIREAENKARIDEVKKMKAFVMSTAMFDENETQHDRRLEFLIKRLNQLKQERSE